MDTLVADLFLPVPRRGGEELERDHVRRAIFVENPRHGAGVRLPSSSSAAASV